MNYISEIDRFHDWLETNELPKSAVALWYALMHINHKTEWKKSFEVAISTLEFKTKFKRSELFEARTLLTQKGRISWKARGGNLCASYQITPFCVRIADAKTYTVADAKAYAKPTQARTQRHTINNSVSINIDIIKEYFNTSGYSEESALKFFNYYSASDWHDKNGKPVKNWKLKAQSVWFKPENIKPVEVKPKSEPLPNNTW